MAETLPDPAIWRTTRLRLTALPETGEPLLLVRDWWHAITGAPPFRVVEDPQGGTVELVGTYQDGILNMQAERGRVDIRRPYAVGDQPPDTLPPLREALTSFTELAAGWFKSDAGPPIRRLALGADALKFLPGSEDCRSVLDACLPTVDMQRTEPVGFLFQVNRRCTSKTDPNLAVNRIAKWSVHQVRPVQGNMYGIELEMDLNSDADHASQLGEPAALFEEFAHYAEKFAREGDQPS